MTDNTISGEAIDLALITEDAYSYNRYGSIQWTLCAQFLLDTLYLSKKDAEIVLRSKVMRWAADEYADSDREKDYPDLNCLIKWVEEKNAPFSNLGLRSKKGKHYSNFRFKRNTDERKDSEDSEYNAIKPYIEFWQSLAHACGAECSGFSYFYHASFVWPSGNVTHIDRDMRDALIKLTGVSMPEEGIK